MTQLLHKEIPLCQFMQLEITSLDSLQINACAPLSPNKNIHQTGFAGSLYALAIATGWAYIKNLLQLADNPATEHYSLILKKADIRYRLPVKSDIYLQCGFVDTEKENLLHQLLNEQNPHSVPLKIAVLSDGRTCAQVMGEYVVQQT